MNSIITNKINSTRTLAIISHPDAGKTTLTEKLLLYGGALDLAGSVTSKKQNVQTSSDWMEIEKKRGISISSTVLQFEYNGYRLNLLDTPGHRDFSEDTYRVLMAVDAVIMVIDAGKGIEKQTLKLFEICRKRDIPVFTFMNKLDRPAMPPIDLIDQLEKIMGIHAYPMNWPLESGPFFKGVYDRLNKKVHLFERTPGGSYKAAVSIHDISDPFVKEILPGDSYDEIREELEMLDIAQEGFDENAVLEGRTTPVFFGSAANNFGIELLLKGFLDYSNPPIPRKAGGNPVPLEGPAFSGFIFKIQTNMNPQHRDRMIFARICSGKFTRDMSAYNTRTGKEVRLANSHNFFGREREIVNEAYPGDIIGFVTNSDFHLGDTISSDPSLEFNEIPRFAPECFAYIHNKTMSAYKSFRKGIDHLLSEHIVQAFQVKGHTGLPLLGAVGPLQFEVLQQRLLDEYGVETSLEIKQWVALRWLGGDVTGEDIESSLPYGSVHGTDDKGKPVILFPSDWIIKHFAENNPSLTLMDVSAGG